MNFTLAFNPAFAPAAWSCFSEQFLAICPALAVVRAATSKALAATFGATGRSLPHAKVVLQLLERVRAIGSFLGDLRGHQAVAPSGKELGAHHVVGLHLVIVESDLGHVNLENVIVLQIGLGFPCVVLLPRQAIKYLCAVHQFLVLRTLPERVIVFHGRVLQLNVMEGGGIGTSLFRDVLHVLIINGRF